MLLDRFHSGNICRRGGWTPPRRAGTAPRLPPPDACLPFPFRVPFEYLRRLALRILPLVLLPNPLPILVCLALEFLRSLKCLRWLDDLARTVEQLFSCLPLPRPPPLNPQLSSTSASVNFFMPASFLPRYTIPFRSPPLRSVAPKKLLQDAAGAGPRPARRERPASYPHRLLTIQHLTDALQLPSLKDMSPALAAPLLCSPRPWRSYIHWIVRYILLPIPMPSRLPDRLAAALPGATANSAWYSRHIASADSTSGKQPSE